MCKQGRDRNKHTQYKASQWLRPGWRVKWALKAGLLSPLVLIGALSYQELWTRLHGPASILTLH
jgi:hypothetical protein